MDMLIQLSVYFDTLVFALSTPAFKPFHMESIPAL